jgi:hypothetical protein
MKKLYMLAAACFAAFALQAQYYYLPGLTSGNPGGLNADDEYPVGGGLTTGWTNILPGGQTTPSWSAAQTVPFTFQFNGSAASQFKVSSSGVLTFDINAATAPAYGAVALPNANIPDNSVCVLGLSNPGANDNVVTKTFGTAPNRQLWVMFSSFESFPAGCWTYWSIVLEETSNKIYVVDQRNSGAAACATANFSVGIQVNGSTAEMVATSPSLRMRAQADPSDGDNVYYEFIQGTRPNLDMAGVEIDVDNFLVASQAPFTVRGKLFNVGSNPITSLTLNYQVGNGTPVTANITGLNIGSMQEYTFTHPTTWNPGIGTFELKAFATNLNGSTDGNTSNDIVSKTIAVVSQIYPRMPLYEVFTSSTCGPCRPGNANLDALFGANPTAGNQIRYQQNFPGTGDPYGTTEAVNRRGYYAVNAIPNLQIDGGDATGGWSGNAASVTAGIMNTMQQRPAFVDIQTAYALDGQKIDVNIELYPAVSINRPLKLYVAIYERTTFLNVKSNGETEFHYVMKKMVPNNTGTVIPSLTAGTMTPFTLSYTFNGNRRLPNNYNDQINHATEHSVEDFNNLGVIVWVQDDADKHVLQSANSRKWGLVSVEDGQLPFTLNFFPNPAQNDLRVATFAQKTGALEYTVLNNVGQVVMSGAFNVNAQVEEIHSMDVSALSNGLYIMRVNDGETMNTFKFNIAK